MKFSELLTEYLALRDDIREDDDWTPIYRKGQRREQMQELLDQMDAILAQQPTKETP